MTGRYVSSTALENAHQIAAFGSLLLRLSGYNSLAGAQFIMLFDSLTLPADGSFPTILIPAASTAYFDSGGGWMPDGVYFANGIWVANSTTAPTKTIGAANCFFNAIVAR